LIADVGKLNKKQDLKNW